MIVTKATHRLIKFQFIPHVNKKLMSQFNINTMKYNKINKFI